MRRTRPAQIVPIDAKRVALLLEFFKGPSKCTCESRWDLSSKQTTSLGEPCDGNIVAKVVTYKILIGRLIFSRLRQTRFSLLYEAASLKMEHVLPDLSGFRRRTWRGICL